MTMRFSKLLDTESVINCARAAVFWRVVPNSVQVVGAFEMLSKLLSACDGNIAASAVENVQPQRV